MRVIAAHWDARLRPPTPFGRSPPSRHTAAGRREGPGGNLAATAAAATRVRTGLEASRGYRFEREVSQTAVYDTHTDRLEEVRSRIRRQRLAAAILTAPLAERPGTAPAVAAALAAVSGTASPKLLHPACPVLSFQTSLETYGSDTWMFTRRGTVHTVTAARRRSPAPPAIASSQRRLVE